MLYWMSIIAASITTVLVIVYFIDMVTLKIKKDNFNLEKFCKDYRLLSDTIFYLLGLDLILILLQV